MQLKITSPFIALPVRYSAPSINIAFLENGKVVYDLDVNYDSEKTDHTYYIDVSRFSGRAFDVEFSDGKDRELSLSDNRPNCCENDSALRPKIHFTAPEGWLNDPNGLCFHEGKYHIFYQLNPCGRHWGNMHWGHAVSDNLVDFTHRDIALFEDETGMMYSGSGYVDEDNVLGLNTTEHKAMLIYYTAAGGQTRAAESVPYEQYLAVSTDGGKSFTPKFGGKPVLSHIVGTNRDPKIVKHKESGKYIMSLYLEGSRFGLYSSEDLVNWEPCEVLDCLDDYECPAFFPLTSPDGSEKWVLQGAFDRYIMGSFDGKHFTPETGLRAISFTRFSGVSSQHVAYAAQSFTDLPDRTVRFFWVKTECSIETDFNGCFSLPQRLFLRDFGEYGLRLCAEPVKEVSERFGECIYGEVGVAKKNIALPGAANAIELTFPENACGKTKLSFMGLEAVIDFDERKMVYTSPIGEKPTSKGEIFPVDGKYAMLFITDTVCVEGFLAGGSTHFCGTGNIDVNSPCFEIDGETPAEISVRPVKPSVFKDERSGVR